jgi:hypothetical protein
MSNEVETWVQRFRVLDTQEEEEAIDDSVQYRALLAHGREEQGRTTAQAEAKARKPR